MTKVGLRVKYDEMSLELYTTDNEELIGTGRLTLSLVAMELAVDKNCFTGATAAML